MPQIFHPSANTLSTIDSLRHGGWSARIAGAELPVDPVALPDARCGSSGNSRCRSRTSTTCTAWGSIAGIATRRSRPSAFAGMPPTYTCMSCHSQIWSDSPMLEPVRASLRERKPLAWTRVHDLPDFVYFHHGIHVQKGVGCVSCHGRVDQMPLTWKEEPMTMEWCLDCHRHPEQHLRPKEAVFLMDWVPPRDAAVAGARPHPEIPHRGRAVDQLLDLPSMKPLPIPIG